MDAHMSTSARREALATCRCGFKFYDAMWDTNSSADVEVDLSHVTLSPLHFIADTMSWPAFCRLWSKVCGCAR